MKARRYRPPDHGSRAMQLYTQLWGSGVRPFGRTWARMNDELMQVLKLLTQKERRLYYSHVAQVVASLARPVQQKTLSKNARNNR